MPRAVTIVLLFFAGLAVADSDRFDMLKSRLDSAQCVHLRFLSVLESDIFESADTAQGELFVEPHGRYSLQLGDDRYIFDGNYFWSYSAYNHQATRERIASGDDRVVSVSFLTDLGNYYQATPVVPGRKYQLRRKSTQESEMPDSLVLSMRQDSLLLDKIEYRDVNGELTRILFLDQVTDRPCGDSLFQPSFPDSTEIIEL